MGRLKPKCQFQPEANARILDFGEGRLKTFITGTEAGQGFDVSKIGRTNNKTTVSRAGKKYKCTDQKNFKRSGYLKILNEWKCW